MTEFPHTMRHTYLQAQSETVWTQAGCGCLTASTTSHVVPCETHDDTPLIDLA